MKPTKSRDMSLLDVMILVAAAAVGCSFVGVSQVRSVIDQGYNLKYYYNYGVAFGSAVYPVWLCLTFAALAIRLRPPRPRLRRLARQPGLVASLSVTLAAPILLVVFLLGASKLGWRLGDPIPANYFGRLPFQLSCMVFGAWIAQALNGRWHPEASAIDRFGRLLGLGWIGFYLFETIWYFLYFP
jgi:hypothetical protein